MEVSTAIRTCAVVGVVTYIFTRTNMPEGVRLSTILHYILGPRDRYTHCKSRPKPPAQEGHKGQLAKYLLCQFTPEQTMLEVDFRFQPFHGI